MPSKRKAKDANVASQDAAATSKKAKKTSSTVATHDTKHTKYTPQQERAIAEFQGITQADRTAASRILRSTGWNVSNAVNLFYTSGSSGASSATLAKIGAVFDGYRDDPDNNDELGFDGVSKLLTDLDIGLEDIGALVLFEVVQSPALGKITRKGFVDGFKEHHADSISKMRNVVLSRRSQLPTNTTVFKAVYNHTFALSIEPPKKAIDLEQAAELWKLLFSEDGYTWDTENVPWLEWWLDFLTTKWNKAVNKDLWRQTFAFAEASKKDPSLSFWNEESSWPSVIDDFVEWVKSEKKIGDAMEVE